MQLKDFIESFALPVKNLALYQQAFTHSSYLNENSSSHDYERLEFLGDSILANVICQFLFKKTLNLRDMVIYKHYLAGNKLLAKVGRHLHFERYILVGKGMMTKKTSPSLLADVFEAFIAAILLNGCWKDVTNFVHKHLLIPHFKSEILEMDFKTTLQEKAMKHFSKLPSYTITFKETNFIAICQLNVWKTQGVGSTKKIATKAAARLMLFKLQKLE